VQAQQQNTYYVLNGKTLEIAHDNPFMPTTCDGKFGFFNQAFTLGTTLLVCNTLVGV